VIDQHPSLSEDPPLASVDSNGAAIPAVLGLHHVAYRCRDAEETRRFYEDVLGLPLYHFIRADNVPSTGELCPYVHIFFRMRDGSFIAFFDLGDQTASLPSPNTPAWVNHIALQVESVEAVRAMRERLEKHGVEVLGVTDHRIIQSIYLFDPNGIRVEFTAKSVPDEQMERESLDAHRHLEQWTFEKQGRRLAESTT